MKVIAADIVIDRKNNIYIFFISYFGSQGNKDFFLWIFIDFHNKQNQIQFQNNINIKHDQKSQ